MTKKSSSKPSLAQRLEVREFDVTTALNGEDALERLEHEEVDLVVLDLQMPGVDGIAVLRKIKELKPLIEVIDFLIKPTETEELVEKINRAFDRKAEQDERIREAEIGRIVKKRGW